MPERVVDQLEAVQVEVIKARRYPGPQAMGSSLGQEAFQLPAVIEASQLIVRGLILQTTGGNAPFRNVFADNKDLGRFTVAVEQGSAVAYPDGAHILSHESALSPVASPAADDNLSNCRRV